jgi:pimeloyl-ACP methyl ester carboxylesterase
MQKLINGISVNRTGSLKNRAIIFIHGFPFDQTMWHKQVEHLSKNYCCITYDIRGLGESYVGDGQYTMEAYASDLIAITEELKLDKPVLCGLSMGGYILLRTAERDQSRFSGLILCNTKSDSDNDAAKLVRAQKIDQINTEGADKFVSEFVPNCFADETIKDKKKIYEEILNKAKTQNSIGLKGALLAMAARTSTTNFLKEINIPVLLIAGSLDKLMPPPVMRTMSEQISNSEFGITPRAGHLAPVENPGFVNDMISGFLKRRINND